MPLWELKWVDGMVNINHILEKSGGYWKRLYSG